jgi:hypothetical protein
MQHKYQTQMRLTKLLQQSTICNLLEQFLPDIQLSCMKHFAMFLFFCDLVFLILENRSQTKNLGFYSFLVLFSVRIVVEYVKESQGGFESTLDYFLQVNGLVYHLFLIGLYFIYSENQ